MQSDGHRQIDQETFDLRRSSSMALATTRKLWIVLEEV